MQSFNAPAFRKAYNEATDLVYNMPAVADYAAAEAARLLGLSEDDIDCDEFEDHPLWEAYNYILANKTAEIFQKLFVESNVNLANEDLYPDFYKKVRPSVINPT